jgi:hypothetical protein
VVATKIVVGMTTQQLTLHFHVVIGAFQTASWSAKMKNEIAAQERKM